MQAAVRRRGSGERVRRRGGGPGEGGSGGGGGPGEGGAGRTNNPEALRGMLVCWRGNWQPPEVAQPTKMGHNRLHEGLAKVDLAKVELAKVDLAQIDQIEGGGRDEKGCVGRGREGEREGGRKRECG